jgi:hypothetical protein
MPPDAGVGSNLDAVTSIVTSPRGKSSPKSLFNEGRCTMGVAFARKQAAAYAL